MRTFRTEWRGNQRIRIPTDDNDAVVSVKQGFQKNPMTRAELLDAIVNTIIPVHILHTMSAEDIARAYAPQIKASFIQQLRDGLVVLVLE